MAQPSPSFQWFPLTAEMFHDLRLDSEGHPTLSGRRVTCVSLFGYIIEPSPEFLRKVEGSVVDILSITKSPDQCFFFVSSFRSPPCSLPNGPQKVAKSFCVPVCITDLRSIEDDWEKRLIHKKVRLIGSVKTRQVKGETKIYFEMDWGAQRWHDNFTASYDEMYELHSKLIKKQIEKNQIPDIERCARPDATLGPSSSSSAFDPASFSSSSNHAPLEKRILDLFRSKKTETLSVQRVSEMLGDVSVPEVSDTFNSLVLRGDIWSMDDQEYQLNEQ